MDLFQPNRSNLSVRNGHFAFGSGIRRDHEPIHRQPRDLSRPRAFKKVHFSSSERDGSLLAFFNGIGHSGIYSTADTTATAAADTDGTSTNGPIGVSDTTGVTISIWK